MPWANIAGSSGYTLPGGLLSPRRNSRNYSSGSTTRHPSMQEANLESIIRRLDTFCFPGLLIAMLGLSGCFSANIVRFEQDLASRTDALSSYEQLEFIDLALEKSRKMKIASPLPVVRTEHGDAFVLALTVPAGAKAVYFRSILSTSISSTSHIAFPTFFFFDSNFTELERIEPKMKAVYATNLDSMYFEQTLVLPENSSKVAAIFSPKHFGQQIVYDATMHYGTMVGAVPVTGSKKSDYGIPIGPGGPFRVEFKSE